MKTKIKKKPRIYNVGFSDKFQVKDFGKIFLNANEQITFVSRNREYDFSMKNWGYYATPSINGRLKNNNYKTFLVKNIYNKIYIMGFIVVSGRKCVRDVLLGSSLCKFYFLSFPRLPR